MFSKTIEPAKFSQCSQFIFREQDAPFEILQRLEWAGLPLPNELFSVFLAQSVYHAKSETHRVVIDDCALPIGLQHANRFDVYTVPLCIFHNRRWRVEAHRLIVNEARVKLLCAVAFLNRTAISPNSGAQWM